MVVSPSVKAPVRAGAKPVIGSCGFGLYRFAGRNSQSYERFFDGSGESVRDISGAIEADGGPPTVFAWSELPWLYATGEYENPTRFYTSFLGEIVPGAKDEILKDLAEDPPAYIVISETTYAPFGELEAWMDGRYQLLTAAGDWRLYRRSS